jgi:hypothetical protein
MQNTKNRKSTHTDTKKEMDHIYISQFTQTQSYQLVQKYDLNIAYRAC